MIAIGIQASYLIGDPQTEVPVRIVSRPYRSGSDSWLPRIVAGTDPEIRTAVRAPWAEGRVSASYGSIDVANADGKLDEWMDGSWSGQPAEVRVGDPADDWEDWQLVAIARLNHPEYIDGRIIRLTFRTRIEDLEESIQKARFEGTPIGDLNGQHLPMIVGRPWQLPALVYDEVSTDEIYYYVAENFHPWNTTSWVREGLAQIHEGTAPGQFQDWPPHGFRLNSQPTLPITVLGAGPRRPLIPWLQADFADWTAGDNGEVPDSPWDVFNQAAGSRELKRFGDTRSFELLLDDGTLSFVSIRLNTELLEVGEEYILRVWVVDEKAWSNRCQMRVMSMYPGEGATTVRIVEDIDWESGPQDFAFSHSGTAAQTQLKIDFAQHPNDVAAEPSRVRIERIQLLRADEPALTLSEIVPYLVCDRGPFHYEEVDHAALVAATAATGYLELGHYWQDATTYRDLLDLLCRSCDVVWWISRTGQWTCAPYLLTDDESVLEFDDSNRTTRIEVVPTPTDRLTDSFKYLRNFEPVRQGDSADTVTEGTKAAGARDYRSTRIAGASVRNALHPGYSQVVGAEPEATAIVGPGGGALQDRADRRLEDHETRIQHYLVEGVLTTQEQAALQLMKNITLYSPRLGLSPGKKVQVIDIRLRPVSGRVQITARG